MWHKASNATPKTTKLELHIQSHPPSQVARAAERDRRAQPLQAARHSLSVDGEAQGRLGEIQPNAYQIARVEPRRRLPITHELTAVTQEAFRVVEPALAQASSAKMLLCSGKDG